MSGSLAIDFGTSNTVIARWDDVTQAGRVLHVPNFGRYIQQGDEQISVIPSLIHYGEHNRHSVGQQVIQRNLVSAEQTFRWMKRYIGQRSPNLLKVNGRKISFHEAGGDFLSAILFYSSLELGAADEEVAFTLPVEAYEHYEAWFSDVAQSAGIRRFRFLDEASAAALGYGGNIQAGDVYLVFDFGGGTLDVSIVLIETPEEARGGLRCRVLGKAGADLGGATLDQILYQEIITASGMANTDPTIQRISRQLLLECETAKIKLSSHEKASITVVDPESGAVIAQDFTRWQFERLLDENEVLEKTVQTVKRALAKALERGYTEDKVKAVLLVGGSSQIPVIQTQLRHWFGSGRVKLQRPIDAIVRGAAAFIAGVDLYDHIQHDYAIRFVNGAGSYDYQILVKAGTPYPTPGPVAQMIVKASFTGQTHLGLAIFEMGESRRQDSRAPMELIFTPSGDPQIAALSPSEEERRVRFWMNEKTPTFLTATPSAQRGESRFEVKFSIDGNKRLLLTARDLVTNNLVYSDHPVIKLT